MRARPDSSGLGLANCGDVHNRVVIDIEREFFKQVLYGPTTWESAHDHAKHEQEHAMTSVAQRHPCVPGLIRQAWD